MSKLKHIINIQGKITLKTGLHIGGSEVELDIGGIDNAVIKDALTNRPYIPGSSLKGKMRHLLGEYYGYNSVTDDKYLVTYLFGEGAKKNDKVRLNGKLQFEDCFVIDEKEIYTEDKTENTIDRTTGEANPRNIERVIRETTFNLKLSLKIYDKIKLKKGIVNRGNKKVNDYNNPISYNKTGENSDESFFNIIRLGFNLLENDYLGGSGTRGYGKIKIAVDQVIKKTFKDSGLSEEELMSADSYDFNLRNLKTDESS